MVVDIGQVVKLFTVAVVDSAVIHEALELSFSDFEDSVTAARHSRCDFVVTRDPKAFRGSPVRSLTPEAVLPLIS